MIAKLTLKIKNYSKLKYFVYLIHIISVGEHKTSVKNKIY
jgi:hypothetical protein